MKKSKPQKGEIQYISARKKATIIRTTLLFILSFSILSVGYFSTGGIENYLTIIGVLGVLPATRSAVEMITILRVKPISKPLYNKLYKLTKNSELFLQYNLYLTSEKKNFPIDALFVINQSIIGYTTNEKCNCKNAKSHILAYMKKDGYSPKNVNIVAEESKFILAINSNLKSIPNSLDNKIVHALKLLSI
jgi:hypothetical protein